jgi:2-polyprenyl-3-methyl-5-hydroxy-6-metoxy-1,4-benzoquinol methylase
MALQIVRGDAMNAIQQSNIGRERLVNDLSALLGGQNRVFLERLPTDELWYLASRADLQKRYADPHRGPILLEWEMSAVERGELALADIEACGLVDWKNARALDVGCGDGGFLVAMARRHARAYGLDFQEFNILGAALRARAWELPVSVAVGSATSLPYRSASFDVVTCGDVIEHLADPLGALREVRRVIRPGGFFWIAAPTRWLLANLWRDPHYGYFGISALPRQAAAWYLARIRRALPAPEQFAVERLPAYGATVATLRRMGFDILAGEYRPLTAVRNPVRMESRWKRRIVTALVRLGLRAPLTLFYRFLAELRWPVRLVCRKT